MANLCSTGGLASGALVAYALTATSCVQEQPLLFGSWGQCVKVGEEPFRYTDDLPDTVKALRATGQNFLIYSVDTDAEYEIFRDLLGTLYREAHFPAAPPESDDSEPPPPFYVFAALGKPVRDAENRWFKGGTGPPWPPGDGTTRSVRDAKRDYIEMWREAYVAAAKDLARLREDHPYLLGLALNDIHDFVETAEFPACVFGDRLTRTDMQVIADAASSNGKHPGFGIWPVTYHTSVAQYLFKGYVLGINYALTLADDERMTVALRFHLNSAATMRLRFFHSEDGDDPGIYKSVYVGPGPLGSYERLMYESLASGETDGTADDYLKYTTLSFRRDEAGDHAIEFRLTAHPSGDRTTEHGRRGQFWRIFGVSLERLEKGSWVQVDFAENFSTDPSPESYVPLGLSGVCHKEDVPDITGAVDDNCMVKNTDDRGWPDEPGDCSLLDDDPKTGCIRGRLVAAPNTDYLLTGLIGGAIICSTYTDSHSDPEDAHDPAYHYETFLETSKSLLGDKRLLALHWSMRDGVVMDPGVQVARLEISARIADATGVWNHPNGLYFMDGDKRGVFAEPVEPEAANTMECVWPGRHSQLPGWYMRWASPTVSAMAPFPIGGITVSDNHAADADYTGLFWKSIKDVSGSGASTFLYGPVDVHADGTGEETVSGFALDAGHHLEVELLLDPSLTDHTFSHHGTKAVFKPLSSVGAPLPTDAWTFESGVANEDVINMYEWVSFLFRWLRFGPDPAF